MARSRRPAPALAPPAILTRPGVWLALLGVLLLPFLVPVPVSLQRNLVVATLGDRAHVFLFAALTLALYWRGPLAGRLLPAALVAVAVGGAVELLQGLVGRAPLWHDFLLDLVGVGLAAGLVAWRGHGRRAGLVLILALVGFTLWELRGLPGRKQAVDLMGESFPLLADFEGPGAVDAWRRNHHGRYEATADGVMLLTGAPDEDWPGAYLTHFPHDWSAYDSLKVDLKLVSAAADTVPVGLRLDDFTGRKDGDWLSRGFHITARWRTCAVPVRDQQTRWSRRPFDAADVFALAIFHIEPDDTVVVAVDNLRLE